MVFILSWNVAGWSSTVERIRGCFSTLHEYFEATGADIIALQEVKSNWDAIRKRPFQAGACDQKQNELAGWESFWACSSGLRGFNGVATFAKKGLVHRAVATPFPCAKLNDEGRCLVTYHSHFVLFNVYCVNGRGGERQAFKDEFLAALLAEMRRVRLEARLPVILCGDMNICYRTQDAHWSHRRLSFAPLIRLASGVLPGTEGEGYSTCSGAVDLKCNGGAGHGPPSAATVTAAQRVMHAVASHLQECDEHRDLVASKVPAEGDRSTCGGLRLPAQRILQLVMAEHMRDSVWVSQFLTHHFADAKNTDFFVVSQFAGIPPHPASDRRWVEEELLKRDGMVDVLAYLYPRAAGCATCWDQSRNKRFENCGNRIDFFFIDPGLVPSLSRDLQHLQSDLERDALLDVGDIAGRAGVRRVTENGRYRPAPTLGATGLEPLSRADATLQFRGLPSTGLFLSPPQFSDHIGVTLLLDIRCEPRRGDAPNATGTSAPLDGGSIKCMYRAEYKHSVLDLFARRAATLKEQQQQQQQAGRECEGLPTRVARAEGGGGIAEAAVATTPAPLPPHSQNSEVICISDDD